MMSIGPDRVDGAHPCAFADDDAMERRLGEFLNGRIGRHLSRREQKESFALYAHGILGEGERKSVEPIAARATGGVEEGEENGRGGMRTHASSASEFPPAQSLGRPQRAAGGCALRRRGAREARAGDDVDHRRHRLSEAGQALGGRAASDSGTLGKVGNCQVGVSLTIATKHEHVPIDFALYMPKSWTDDVARREKARVPEDLVFKTKPELALDLITRALEDRIPRDILLVDAAYGGSSDFRNAVRIFGLGKDEKMIRRWVALGIAEAQKGFRRVKGYVNMPSLVAAIRPTAATVAPEKKVA
jgi:hypothetical protein